MNYKKDAERTEGINAVTVNSRIVGWVNNLLTNVPEINGGYGVASLINKMKDIPVIVVGSGPTLDRNIHDLVGLEDKALIISCGSNTAALQKVGVNPHLVLMADSLKGNQHCIDGVDISVCNYVLDSFVHPETVKRLMGAKRIYWYNGPPLPICPFTGKVNEWTGGLGIIVSGGCGATAAWSLGKSLCGGNPNIIVGLPEAYYDPQVQYSKRVMDTHGVSTYVECIETEDYLGVTCYTNPAYQSFAAWFEHAYLHTPGQHINCSEGGIIKEGCLTMTLKQCRDMVLNRTFDIESALFADELLVDEWYENAVRPEVHEYTASEQHESWWTYRSFMTMMLPMHNGNNTNIPELTRRMGWTDQKIAQEVTKLREFGVNIFEEPVVWTPDPNRPQEQTLSYRLEEPEPSIQEASPDKKPFTHVELEGPVADLAVAMGAKAVSVDE